MSSRPKEDDSAPLLAKVSAIIREQQLDAVLERLVMIGVRGLTIGKTNGAGGATRPTQVFRGLPFRVAFVPQVLLEWYGPEREADAIVRAIEQRARTGKVGDGRIFVQRVEEAVRIRTGERGPNAL
jgi:nitrogen regulatory protein P-II 1